MIACDKCNEWFHGECIKISEKQSEFIDLYYCENCAKGKYFFNIHRYKSFYPKPIVL